MRAGLSQLHFECQGQKKILPQDRSEFRPQAPPPRQGSSTWRTTNADTNYTATPGIEPRHMQA